MKLMRKKILLTLVLTFYLSMIFSQEKKTWDFPVRPGSSEWENLLTFEDKLNAYNIPEDILYEMKTSDLVKSCLSYPELRLIMTRNSFQDGYNYLKTIFNGFNELENREDAGKELLKVYKKMDPGAIKNINIPAERGRYIFKFIYIEILLSQNKTIANIDKKNKKELIAVTLLNYEKRDKMPEHFSTFGKMSSTLILGRILEHDQYSKYGVQKKYADKIKRFIDNSYLEDVSTMLQIVALSKEYLNQLENE